MMMTVLLSATLAGAQTGLKINDLFEGRIIPQERMIETRVRGKTLAKYQLSYYRSVRFTVGESEADRVLKMVEDDSKGHFASRARRCSARSTASTLRRKWAGRATATASSAIRLGGGATRRSAR